MASITSLSFTASSPQVMSKRVSNGPSTNGFGPRVMVVPMSYGESKNTSSGGGSKRLSMVVKAQNYEGVFNKVNPTSSTTNHLGQDNHLLDTSRFELTPWDYKEEAHKIKMWFNMPGVASQDLKVYIKDNKLFVQGKHLTLPHNIRKEDIKAKLGNGVLYVSIPKTTPEFEAHSILVQPVSW